MGISGRTFRTGQQAGAQAPRLGVCLEGPQNSGGWRGCSEAGGGGSGVAQEGGREGRGGWGGQVTKGFAVPAVTSTFASLV